MGIAVSIAGIVLVLVGLLDMFRTLLHPPGSGTLSSAVMKGAWKASMALGHRAGSVVGPASMVAAVLVWVLLLGGGWAMIFGPHLPGSFSFSSGADLERTGVVVESLYVSYMTLSTLGLGDVIPLTSGLRLATTIEALTGFALLTSAMTWFVQVYPPLMRRRSLGLRLAMLGEADLAGSMSRLDARYAATVLDSVAAMIATVRVDLTQHSETYYFQEQSPRLSLARQLPIALALHDAAAVSEAPELRMSARSMGVALDELADVLRSKVSGAADGGRDEVFRAYAAEHRRAQQG